MWDAAAGNNLITADGANKELTVNTSTDPNPFFIVVPEGGGPDKLDSPPFTRFHGNVFLLFFVFCLLLFPKSPYSPLLSLIDERYVTVCSS